MTAESRLRRGDDPVGVQKVFKLTDRELKDLQEHIKKHKGPDVSTPNSPVHGQSPGQSPFGQGDLISGLQAQINGLKQRITDLENQLLIKPQQKAPAKKAARKKSA